MAMFDVSLTIQDIEASSKAEAAGVFFAAIAAQIGDGEIHVNVTAYGDSETSVEVSGDAALAYLRTHLPADPVKPDLLAALKVARKHLAIYESGDTLDEDRADLAMIDKTISAAEGEGCTEGITSRALDLIRVISQTSSPSGGWTFEGMQDAMASFIEDAKAIVAEVDTSADPFEVAARAAGWRFDGGGIYHPDRDGNGTGDPVEYADDWKEACEISGIDPLAPLPRLIHVEFYDADGSLAHNDSYWTIEAALADAHGRRVVVTGMGEG